jgi:hypothetical protein
VVDADRKISQLYAQCARRRLEQIGGILASTLRWRVRGASQTTVAGYLAERSALVADSFVAERFVLYSARAGSGGGPYVVEAAYPLG